MTKISGTDDVILTGVDCIAKKIKVFSMQIKVIGRFSLHAPCLCNLQNAEFEVKINKQYIDYNYLAAKK